MYINLTGYPLNESHAQFIAIKLQPPTMNERYGLFDMRKAVEQAVQSAMLMCSYAFICFMNHGLYTCWEQG